MDQECLRTIRERASQSRAQNDQVRVLLPQGPAPSLRANFARCAVDLAHEHHSGLIRLVEAEEFGTAGALLRPLLEASTAAFWLMYVASCESIQALPTTPVENSAADLPLLRDMAKDLTLIFPPIQVIVDGFQKGGRSKWLHKYTHGGTPQLARRGPGWSRDEVMLTLIRADLFAILGACLETVIEPNRALSIYGFSRRDELSSEVAERFNVTQIPQQPHELPPALKDGCGHPFDNPCAKAVDTT
ncbi:hypothetical protein HDE80_000715 [Rhodanobacter sp. A1T4]|nr:hypothetical protein [Rhodanobacter sp. A1T4]